jgi:DNA-binding transcriptional MocR family regulator
MGKRGKWKDDALQWTTDTGEFDRELTALSRSSESKPDFVAPGAEQKWRARNLIDIHWALVEIETPSASYNRIFACIIDHANPEDGLCYPSQSIIAIETGYSIDTVQRAIRWWKEQGFLKTERRGIARALAYHPQWNLLEGFWKGVTSDIEEQKASYRMKGRYDVPHEGAVREPHHGAVHNLKVITSKTEPHPERAQPSADAPPIEGQIRGKEEGNQEERVESFSTNSQPPAEPNVYTFININAEKTEAAATAVEADLLRHPLYGALLGWPDLEAHLSEASAAELSERGSGAKLVLARFAKRKAS